MERGRTCGQLRAFAGLLRDGSRLAPVHDPGDPARTPLPKPDLRLEAIQVRSDVERKRLYGYAMDASTGSAVQAGIYTVEAGRQTYARLAELARYLIEGGYTAIVDAAFLRREERESYNFV